MASFDIRDGLADWPLGRLVDENATLIIECQNCPYQTVWTPQEIIDRFPNAPERRLSEVVERMTCSRCRSPKVRVWRAAPGFVPQDST
ncbi:hypothetical protein [Phenylobacterium montanum]|uniref:Uncharacterized protein n=1 Tax=Phenylobacterium montanum TaxID=2823693 RepID=A0A975G4W3_9CAUL|nr:hypothetical protein [Caulobacter sp. S6]QUD90582.1 hypothetical protein KCG34_12275 [Caulobacter sp. S6]